MNYHTQTRSIVQKHAALNLMVLCTPDRKEYTEARLKTCLTEIISLTNQILNENYSVLIELQDKQEVLSIAKGDISVFEITNKDHELGREYYALKCFFIRVRREGKKDLAYDRHIKQHIFSVLPKRKTLA